MSVKNKTLFSSRNFTAEHVKFTKKTTTFFSFFELSEEPFFRIVLIKTLYQKQLSNTAQWQLANLFISLDGKM